MIHDKTTRVGSYGWDHPHWQGSFFPDDLPEDWRLSYYANEVSSVLVPENKWNVPDADLKQWADDVPAGFRFYFLNQHSKAINNPELIMGEKFAGFVSSNNSAIAQLVFQSKSFKEWGRWLPGRQLDAIFLMDEKLTSTQLFDFKSLVEIIGL